MKKLILLALVSATSFVLPATAMAQEAKTPEVNISGPSLTLKGDQTVHYMDETEFAKFERAYDLSNGDTLSLFSRSNRKFAKLGDGRWHAIVATGHNSFMSKDRQLKMEINLQSEDEVSGYLLMPATSPTVAGNDVAWAPSVKVVFR